MSCDVGKAMEGLENELWCRWSDGKVGEWAELIFIVIAELILQPFRHFTYVITHSSTLPPYHLLHSSFSNPSVASLTSQFILQPFFRFFYVTSSFSNLSVTSPPSQLILQPFFRFFYVTSSSLNSPGEPPMLKLYRELLTVLLQNLLYMEHFEICILKLI